MFYYAYLNASNIVTQIVALPSQITVAGYIPISFNDTSLIGMRYNAVTEQFEEVTAFYYAQVDSRGIVIAVFELPSEVVQADFIRVDTLDQTLVGKWLNPDTGTFIVPPIHIMAQISSSVINYKEEDRWLDEVLDGKANAAEVYTKAEIDEMGTQGSPGANAYDLAVQNGYVGTMAQWLASLRGDKGDTGAQGERGVQGIQGVQGAQGIPGAKGDKGADGRSCYDIAVAHGFAGTEAEFVASMKGDKGEKGDPGAKGDKGDKGDTGERGLQGLQGAQGPRGYEGAQGPRGYAGATGATGPQGPAGIDANGNLNSSSNVLRIGGQQMLFNSGAATTLGTNNQPTHIAGSAVYSRVAIQVSSDERLKRNITPADTDRLINFINNIKVKDYTYRLDNERHTGVIAQELMRNDPEYASQFISQNLAGMYSVSFSELVFPLIVAVQELYKRVATLEEEG